MLSIYQRDIVQPKIDLMWILSTSIKATLEAKLAQSSECWRLLPASAPVRRSNCLSNGRRAARIEAVATPPS